ncbi:MAG: hypothetical protein GY942_25065 [Aestuariibacter sp.]|nr:hypothetical protein [Aestuariibacter sp.]
MTVTSDGALGIATTALPRQTLDVNGRIYVNNGVIQRGGGAITSTSDLGLYSQYGGHWMRFVTNAAPFRFFTDSGTGGTARFSIEEDGKVGIGHIDVAAQLDIKGQANTENQISLQLRSGNGSQNFDSNQITLGYNNTDTYRHAVKTRHSSGSQSGNAIDFYTWKYLAADNKDDATDIGTLHTMSLAGGSVGIGTTAPSQKLEVNGLIKAQSLMLGTWPAGANNAFVGGTSDTFDHADSKNYALLQNTTGDATPGRTYLNSPVSISFRLNNDDKMFLDEAGNFGIGTTDINEKLEVAGAIRATSGLYMDKKSTSNLSSAGWHRIASGKGNTSGIFEIRWNAAGRHGHVRFAVSVQYGDDNGAQLKIIDQSSYQGKIVSEIRLLLHNTNDTHFVEFYFNGATYDNRALPFNIFKLSGFGWALVEPTPGQVPSGYANHRIRSDVLFATRAAKSGSYFVIDNSTNVGIGHNSPEEKLHVNGRIKAPPLVIGAWPGQAAGDYAFFGGTSGNFDHTNGENYALLQYTGTSANPGRTYLNSPVDIRFRLKNADKMILDTDGNFGIGTTDPKAALDVNGRILRKGQAFSHAGIADHNASVSVPWGTRADWNIFVSPNSMGAIEAGSEGDNALLVIECTTSAPNTTQWKIHARYWFRFREGSGEWKSGKANYIMIPK